MPTVENTNLELITVDGRVTIRVTYDARFTPFERQLADLGMRYHSHVNAFGMDPGGDSLTGANLVGVDFPTQAFPVTVRRSSHPRLRARPAGHLLANRTMLLDALNTGSPRFRVG